MRVGESPKLKLEVTCAVSHAKDYGRFPLSPGVRVRNQMKGTICLVCPKYSGPSLKVVHFDWSDRNVRFRRLTKFCPQYRSPVSCLQVQYWPTLVNLWLFSSLRASSPFGDIVKSKTRDRYARYSAFSGGLLRSPNRIACSHANTRGPGA